MRTSSPGAARITGGSSRPLNENAALPVLGSLIAFNNTGERVCGGSDPMACLETGIAVDRPLGSSNTPQNKPKHVTHARKVRPACAKEYEIPTLSMSRMSAPLLPNTNSKQEAATGLILKVLFAGGQQFVERVSGFRHVTRQVSSVLLR
jgi:hypothetical protein